MQLSAAMEGELTLSDDLSWLVFQKFPFLKRNYRKPILWEKRNFLFTTSYDGDETDERKRRVYLKEGGSRDGEEMQEVTSSTQHWCLVDVSAQLYSHFSLSHSQLWGNTRQEVQLARRERHPLQQRTMFISVVDNVLIQINNDLQELMTSNIYLVVPFDKISLLSPLSLFSQTKMNFSPTGF